MSGQKKLATEEYDKNVAVNHTSTEKWARLILRIPVVICELTENRLMMNTHSCFNTLHKKKEKEEERFGQKLHTTAPFVCQVIRRFREGIKKKERREFGQADRKGRGGQTLIRWQHNPNIATGKTSPTITLFHFFGTSNFSNFYYSITSITS